MNENRQVGPITLEPTRTDVRSVEKELAGLWRKATEGGMPGVSAPATRVLLANIIVYARNSQEADRASDALVRIAANHPARTIIADAEAGEPGQELEADVSMICNITELGRRLCGEEVRLHAHGQSVTALGTILPVIEPDLPVYLWTPGEITPADPVYDQLLGIAEHWMFDSRQFQNLRAGLDMVTSLAIKREPVVIVHDLAWSALLPWRESIARLFDAVPARAYLVGVRSVEIGCSPGPSVEAKLISSWLIAQLEWTNPAVRFSDADSRLEHVTIECELDGLRGTFRASRTEGGIAIEADAPDVMGARSTVVVEADSTAKSLGSILDAPDREWVYERAIAAHRASK